MALDGVHDINQRQTTRRNQAGGFDDVVEATFMVGDQGPFTVYVPAGTYSGEAMIAAIDARAVEARKVTAAQGQ